MSTPDSGLQPERTLLAWRRTSLGLIANGILLLASGHGSSDVRTGLGIVVLTLSLGCWAAVSAVYRHTRGAAVHSLGQDRVLRVAAGLVLLVGLFDLYAVVTR
ncbi:DUF202 domain-containing protein [Kribbella sandramycini]|uniref:DUF202 domain-containing protein n=1 Tax=Kribbella sandramycini TaxID=60450 RepID=A0A7Y4L252_9ACTN|nr:DUF202 domain-containing protein [Kribbella sandramycini]MBB6566412.1 uncharacterized membrane protein YidH (DUF202 family) [Kribbella sandramycini]NOL42929.1 DUF202 domain-containing protein [Kribbella sandramycini]